MIAEAKILGLVLYSVFSERTCEGSMSWYSIRNFSVILLSDAHRTQEWSYPLVAENRTKGQDVFLAKIVLHVF